MIILLATALFQFYGLLTKNPLFGLLDKTYDINLRLIVGIRCGVTVCDQAVSLCGLPRDLRQSGRGVIDYRVNHGSPRSPHRSVCNVCVDDVLCSLPQQPPRTLLENKDKLTDAQLLPRGTAGYSRSCGGRRTRSRRTCQWHLREESALRPSPGNAPRGSGGSFLTFCWVCLWWFTRRWVRSCSSRLKEEARPRSRMSTVSSWVRLSAPSRTSPVSSGKYLVWYHLINV